MHRSQRLKSPKKMKLFFGWCNQQAKIDLEIGRPKDAKNVVSLIFRPVTYLNILPHYKKICFNFHQLTCSYFDFTSAVT
jgi:hypothetical protein